MKNPTLQQRLVKYSGAAAAALSAPAAFGQILYTDVNPDEIVTGNLSSFYLDLNGDNINDFMAVTIDSFYGSAPVKIAGIGYYYTSTYGNGNSSNEVMYSGNGVARLNAAESVDASQNWQNGGFLGAKLYGYPIYNLPWDAGAQDKFVGLKVELNGSFYYGWVRLDVNQASDTIIVKDMAINSVAGAPILTGANGLATIEELKQKMQVICAEGHLEVKTDADFGNFALRVTDLSGKVIIHRNSRAGERNVWSTAEWAKGTYVVALVREDQDYVLSQKVQVQ